MDGGGRIDLSTDSIDTESDEIDTFGIFVAVFLQYIQ